VAAAFIWLKGFGGGGVWDSLISLADSHRFQMLRKILYTF